jgi:hypothetical protein
MEFESIFEMMVDKKTLSNFQRIPNVVSIHFYNPAISVNGIITDNNNSTTTMTS